MDDNNEPRYTVAQHLSTPVDPKMIEMMEKSLADDSVAKCLAQLGIDYISEQSVRDIIMLRKMVKMWKNGEQVPPGTVSEE